MEQIDLHLSSELEVNEVHKALHLFEMPTAPTLLDDSAENVSFNGIRPQSSRDTTENESLSQCARRNASLEQKQASNREHQRRFRMRSKVAIALSSRQLTSELHKQRDQPLLNLYKQETAIGNELQQAQRSRICWTADMGECFQARSQAIEEQLARTTAELQELKSRHQQLESVLERISHSHQDTVAQSPPAEVSLSYTWLIFTKHGSYNPLMPSVGAMPPLLPVETLPPIKMW